MLRSAEGPCEDKTRKHRLERNLVHPILCREFAITFGALEGVFCVKVLKGYMRTKYENVD